MLAKPKPFEAGQVFTVAYPFVRGMTLDMDVDGSREVPTWNPGVEWREGVEDDWAIADGVGEMILEVVSVHRPPGWPTRVFYTRKWRDPEGGRPFGRRRLRVTTTGHFRTLIRGYRHPFVVDGEPKREAA